MKDIHSIERDAQKGASHTSQEELGVGHGLIFQVLVRQTNHHRERAGWVGRHRRRAEVARAHQRIQARLVLLVRHADDEKDIVV